MFPSLFSFSPKKRQKLFKHFMGNFAAKEHHLNYLLFVSVGSKHQLKSDLFWATKAPSLLADRIWWNICKLPLHWLRVVYFHPLLYYWWWRSKLVSDDENGIRTAGGACEHKIGLGGVWRVQRREVEQRYVGGRGDKVDEYKQCHPSLG